MKLSGGRLLDVGDVVLKAPLDEAELYQGQKALTFGGIKFHVMALFGEHADRLYDYVKQSGGATESRPAPRITAVSAREQRIRRRTRRLGTDAITPTRPDRRSFETVHARSPACGESRHTDAHGRGGNPRSGEPRLRR